MLNFKGFLMTESSSQEFIQAIVADPHDDLSRMVYADWLEENGGMR
jgi:uncharacterized protein (TIGR02996 family)